VDFQDRIPAQNLTDVAARQQASQRPDGCFTARYATISEEERVSAFDERAVTLCLTSAGRPDLLERTLGSLLPEHGSSFQDVIVIDDLGSAECAQVVRKLCPRATVVLNEARLGQHRSIDRLYGLVKTPFIFHCEDDWRFDPGPMIEDCLKAAMSIPDVSVVCVTATSELEPKTLDQAELKEIDGAKFWLRSATVKPPWGCFTFNPHFVRRLLWEEHGPYAKYPTEADISIHMKAHGLRIAQLVDGKCWHIGANRHVDDPFNGRSFAPVVSLWSSCASFVARARPRRA
jgi:hypothetical protein